MMAFSETDLEPEFLRNIAHRNGQITYKKPGRDSIPKGTEVIVQNLPRSAKIGDVIHLALPYGEILQARLLIDFSGRCRTFAYVAFSTKKMAQLAIQGLNKSTFGDQKLSASMSVDNRRLHISNIPRHCPEHELDRIIRENCSGVEYIIPYMNFENPNLNRGFLFVEFTSHAAAAQARRVLIANGIRDWSDTVVNVEWAEPTHDIPESEAEEITKVFIRNIFGKNGPLTRADLLKFLHYHVHPWHIAHTGSIMLDHVVVEFTSNEVATKAVASLDGLELNGHRVFAELARDFDTKKSAKTRNSPRETAATKYSSKSRRSVTPKPRRREELLESFQFKPASSASESSFGSVSVESDSSSTSGESPSIKFPINETLVFKSSLPAKESNVNVVSLYEILKLHWAPFWALSMALHKTHKINLQYSIEMEERNYKISFFHEQVTPGFPDTVMVLYEFFIHAESPEIALNSAVEKALSLILESSRRF